MSRILSQDEINALITAASTGAGGDDRGDLAGIVVYNFRRPDRVSKGQLRSLHFLHDRFAKNLSTSLSAFLRTMTDVSLVSVEQFAYSEFLMSLSDPTAFYSISMPPLDGIGAFEISPPVAFVMIDRLLGGTGHTPAPNRALTDIEHNVLDSAVKLVLEHLTETWHGIADVRFRIHERETRPQMLQVTGPNEIVILLAFETVIGECRGIFNISIPASAIEPMEDKVAQGWGKVRRPPSPAEEERLMANLGRVPLAVTSLLETRMTARELVRIRPGDLISLGHPVRTPVDVRVGDVRRYRGRLTVDQGRVALAVEHDGAHDQDAAGARA